MTEEQIEELQQKQEDFWREAEETAALYEITLDYYLMEFT